MRIRRAYADAAFGQIHYCTLGTGTPLLLLHYAPGCGRQYEPVLPIVAAAGYRAIAPDLPGYGDSDKPDAPWAIPDYARAIGEMLDDLGIQRLPIVGGHTSAAVAAEFAATHPDRVERLVLDGLPIFSDAERAEKLGSYAQPMDLHANGDHLLWAWQRSFRRPTMPLDRVQAATMDLLKGGSTWHYGHNAVYGYDMAARLPFVPTETLVVSATRDPLFGVHDQAIALLPNARGHIYPGRSPLADPDRAEEWAAPILAFLREPS